MLCTRLVPAVLITLSLVAGSALAQKDQAKGKGKGFKTIFDGKTLEGWSGKKELWSVEDGAITGVTTDENPIKQNTFLIWDGKVGDFELRADFKCAVGNSGIQYRSKIIDKEEFVVGGYQADIDPTMKFAGINYEEKGRGILAQRGTRATIDEKNKITAEEIGDADELASKIKKKGWNKYRIVAKGRTLSHYINGQLMSEVIDNSADKFAAEGVIALQVHRGPAMKIQFKNIRIKELK